MKLSEKVEHVLQKYPQTSNSDVELTLYVWWDFYRSLIKDVDGEKCIPMRLIRELPSEDDMSRIRRKFNEMGKYKATDATVIKRREREKNVESTIKTKDWSQYLGKGRQT